MMISDFIMEYNGFLALSESERCRFTRNFPVAQVILKFSGGSEGYRNSDLFMEQVARAGDIAESSAVRKNTMLSGYSTTAVVTRLMTTMH